MSPNEKWVRGMVADGFSFRLIAGGDRRNPGDYNARRAAPQGLDQSDDLILALQQHRPAWQHDRGSPYIRVDFIGDVRARPA